MMPLRRRTRCLRSFSHQAHDLKGDALHTLRGAAHASHAIDRGAALPVVQATLGHGNISVTSGYLHARPDSSSGLHLDPGVLLR